MDNTPNVNEVFGSSKPKERTVPVDIDLPMNIIRIEINGIKQGMIAAISASQAQLQQVIIAQLQASMNLITPELIMMKVQESFNDAVVEALNHVLPGIIQDAVEDYFTTGPGSQKIVEAIKEKFKI